MCFMYWYETAMGAGFYRVRWKGHRNPRQAVILPVAGIFPEKLYHGGSIKIPAGSLSSVFIQIQLYPVLDDIDNGIDILIP